MSAADTVDRQCGRTAFKGYPTKNIFILLLSFVYFSFASAGCKILRLACLCVCSFGYLKTTCPNLPCFLSRYMLLCRGSVLLWSTTLQPRCVLLDLWMTSRFHVMGRMEYEIVRMPTNGLCGLYLSVRGRSLLSSIALLSSCGRRRDVHCKGKIQRQNVKKRPINYQLIYLNKILYSLLCVGCRAVLTAVSVGRLRWPVCHGLYEYEYDCRSAAVPGDPSSRCLPVHRRRPLLIYLRRWRGRRCTMYSRPAARLLFPTCSRRCRVLVLARQRRLQKSIEIFPPLIAAVSPSPVGPRIHNTSRSVDK